MTAAGALVGIVLAGGRSSRFGRDKLVEPIDGEPLLWRPIRALAAAGCTEIVVVRPPASVAAGSPPDSPRWPALPPDLTATIRLAFDAKAFGGPLVGIRAGLAAATSDPTAATSDPTDAGEGTGRVALVVGGDQPDLAPAVIAELARRTLASGRATALEDETGRPRPLPCALAVSVALEAAERLLALGERRPRALLLALAGEMIPFAEWSALDPTGASLRDIDLPGDARSRRLPPAD